MPMPKRNTFKTHVDRAVEDVRLPFLGTSPVPHKVHAKLLCSPVALSSASRSYRGASGAKRVVWSHDAANPYQARHGIDTLIQTVGN